jgi:hypothetical protein
VAAYVLKFLAFDAGGKVVDRTNMAIITAGVIPSAARKPFSSGEVWTESLRKPAFNGKNPARARVEILAAYVLFDDGSHWGDSSLRQAIEINGMRKGAMAERATIKRRLQAGGQAALVEFLNEKP